jgi:AraC-like DNA-binding protein
MIAGLTDMMAGTTLWPDLTRVPTVSVTYLRGPIDFAVERGVRRRTLLSAAGVRETDLLIDDARLPLESFIAVMRSAAHLSNDPAFALHYGDHVPCERVSLAAPLGQAAGTVREAMHQLNRYARLAVDFAALADGTRYELLTDDAGAWVIDKRPADAWPEITESVFARMARGIRQFTQRSILRAVYVTHAEPAWQAEYVTVFQAPVHFRAPRNALLFEPSWLDAPLRPAPAHLTRILATHADAHLAAMEQHRSTRGRVEHVLRGALHDGDVSMNTVAGTLAMSRQTLYRRLRDEGVTFEQVLDALRHTTAVTLLADPAIPVRDAARRLGFADPAAFSRAFKRWTGRNPSDRV